ILPSFSRYARTQRIATGATIDIRGRSLRVYSTHLGTPADLSHSGRVEQLQSIMRDAANYEYVVLGGDMNSKNIGEIAVAGGYVWPTQTIPRSNDAGRLDHVYLKGLRPTADRPAGTANVGPGISDHRPIWVRAVLVR
ncbi:MAG: endonuclease/exonuclease/phosphatase family protein, partial [Gemmatimonadaceae bacterium]